MSYQSMLDARAIELHDRECSSRRCTPDTMGKWYEIARSEAIIRDGKALDNIVTIMSGNEWDADACDAIAAEVRATGREVEDLDDANDVV